MPPKMIMFVMGSHFLAEAHEASGEQEKGHDDGDEQRVHDKPPPLNAELGVSLCNRSISRHIGRTTPRSRGPK